MISKSIKGRIRIKSIQTEGCESQTILQTADCTLFEKSGDIYIFYGESEDTLAGDVKSKIKISSDSINIVRKGTYRSNIMFKENYECKFRYYMPYGNIDMSVKTSKADVSTAEKKITIRLVYVLNNGESDIKSRMNITIEKVI